jgi:hypothetical protein
MEPLCPTFNFKNIKKNHSLGRREGGTDFEHLDCFQREEILVMLFSSVSPLQRYKLELIKQKNPEHSIQRSS